jgi:chain length determinant protein tyrosine kinase EpsG
MRVRASPHLQALAGGALTAPPPDRRLGCILVARGKLDAAAILRVLNRQKELNCRFGEAAVRMGLISVGDLVHAITTQYELPHLAPGDLRASLDLVTAFEPFHACAEEVRALRSRLLQAPTGAVTADAGRVIAVVSPSHGDGRSYLAANLAVTFAQLGRRTLLVDADLRWPRQHKLFDVPDHIGLATVLGGRADPSAVKPLPAFGPLHLLSAGGCPPNPLDLLEREAWPRLLHTLAAGFDTVLLDTPPAERCADALCLARSAGRALVVARRHATRFASTASLIDQLQADGTCVVGTVFNAP